MQITTKNFGVIKYNIEDILRFEEGIPGFEGLHSFILLNDNSKDTPFRWLQALDDTDIAFVVIDPRIFKPDYSIDISEDVIKALKIEDISHLLIYVIVVIPDEIEKMTANLKAPIIINAKNNKAMQVVLDDDRYLIKHPILEELKNAYTHS